VLSRLSTRTTVSGMPTSRKDVRRAVGCFRRWGHLRPHGRDAPANWTWTPSTACEIREGLTGPILTLRKTEAELDLIL